MRVVIEDYVSRWLVSSAIVGRGCEGIWNAYTQPTAGVMHVTKRFLPGVIIRLRQHGAPQILPDIGLHEPRKRFHDDA